MGREHSQKLHNSAQRIASIGCADMSTFMHAPPPMTTDVMRGFGRVEIIHGASMEYQYEIWRGGLVTAIGTNESF